MTKVKKIIEPAKWYNLGELVSHRAFPWATTYWSVNKLVKNPRNAKLLKVLVKGKGTNTKYHFKGSNIIKFNNQVESGKVRL
jgi:hypothetical protein